MSTLKYYDPQLGTWKYLTTGEKGDVGATGPGVPDGGTTGQVLRKITNGDQDTHWDTLDKTDVGLTEVDNTSDANKPVSSAAQTALNLKANINSPTFTGTVSGVTKTMVGLGNVDNTTDLQKPISTATANALNLKEDKANKGAANGYASLGADGKLVSTQLPALALVDTFVVATQAAMLALAAEQGDVAIRTDLNKTFILSNNAPTVLANWKEMLSPTDAVSSVNGRVGAVTGLAEASTLTSHTSNTNNPHSVTKAQVGLGSVDNTSDSAKPISTLTQTALNAKATLLNVAQYQVPIRTTTGTGEPNTGFTVTENQQNNTIVYRNSTNGRFFIAEPVDPTNPTTKTYVDTAIAAVPIGNYVLKTGDTMSGNLAFSGSSRSINFGSGDGYINMNSTAGLRIGNAGAAFFRLLPQDNDIYFQNTVNTGNIYFTGLNGAFSSGSVVFRVNGGVQPGSNLTTTLGASGVYWSELYARRAYFNSTAYLDGTTAGNIIANATNVQFSGNITMPGTASGISGTSTADIVRIFGGSSTSDGAGILVGGSTNGAIGNIGAFRVGSNEIARWNTSGFAIGGSLAALPTHTLTLPSAGTGFVIYNTSDQLTNYERARQYWSGNVFNIALENAGTGSNRVLRLSNINGTFFLQINNTSPLGMVSIGGNSSVVDGTGLLVQPSLSGSAGVQYGTRVVPTFAQSSTAGYTALLINPSTTSTGSGTQFLIDAQVNGSTRFSVSSAGFINALGGVTAQTFVPNSATAPSNGLYRPTTNTIGISTNGTLSMSIDPTGNMLVVGKVSADGGVKIGTASTVGQVWTATDTTGNGSWQPAPGAGGGISRSVVVLSTVDTIAAVASTDYVVFVQTGGAPTLPTAVGNTNAYEINNDSAADITVSTTSSQTINGNATMVLSPNSSRKFMSNGSNWKVF